MLAWDFKVCGQNKLALALACKFKVCSKSSLHLHLRLLANSRLAVEALCICTCACLQFQGLWSRTLFAFALALAWVSRSRSLSLKIFKFAARNALCACACTCLQSSSLHLSGSLCPHSLSLANFKFAAFKLPLAHACDHSGPRCMTTQSHSERGGTCFGGRIRRSCCSLYCCSECSLQTNYNHPRLQAYHPKQLVNHRFRPRQPISSNEQLPTHHHCTQPHGLTIAILLSPSATLQLNETHKVVFWG